MRNENNFNVREQGSRTAPLLHHQPSFHGNNFYYLRQSNVPSCNFSTMLQTSFIRDSGWMSRCQVTANVNNRCHATCWKQNKASLHAKKKKYFFIHTKSPKQVIRHASITDYVFVFLILSIMPRPSAFKHFPRHVNDFVWSRIIRQLLFTWYMMPR